MKVEKANAFSVGPCHKSGQRIAAIINHAANYWKHKEEWPLDKSPARKNRIRDAFDGLGFSVDSEYPLSGVLTEVVAPDAAAFTPLVAKLANWRDELRKAK